jgi:YD repeat-containing protein
MSVSYDAASRITGIADASNTASGMSYGYDVLDRLTNAISPTAGISYTYDTVGNRLQKNNNGSKTAYTYAATSNRLTKKGTQAISSDATGSITNNGSATFNYDARGRMISANTAIGLVQYTINGLGQRVRKVTPTTTTVFHYDLSGKLIAEATTAAGMSTTQEYVYLGDLPVAAFK